MRLLLVYYHPIIFDLAETFLKIFDEVTICVNRNLKDNYGDFRTVFDRVSENENLDNVQPITSQLAIQKLKNKEYDIVGCDGVFDGDKLIMDIASSVGIPFFNINGYVYNIDEPSVNILSFSWFLPQIQYKSAYQHEGFIKQVDWKNIAEKGQSAGKNVCVFYPEMSYAKRAFNEISVNEPYLAEFVSFIHRFKECNHYSYQTFERVRREIPLSNYSSLSQYDVLDKLYHSKGLVHLKHGDCPGIAVLEALILGTPVLTMSSFVKASFNQEVLIDNFNAIVADSVEELIERAKSIETFDLSASSSDYIYELTSFHRQKHKLERFFQKCLS